MRILVIPAAIALVLAGAGCGGSSKQSSSTPSPVVTARPSAAASTPAAGATPRVTAAVTTPAQGAVVDVTGIVGGVNVSGRTIEIRRLQGAAVTQIAVDATTAIRRADGGTLQLKDIRTSDRIVARGTLNARQTQLVATEITVQAVVEGGQPGG